MLSGSATAEMVHVMSNVSLPCLLRTTLGAMQASTPSLDWNLQVCNLLMPRKNGLKTRFALLFLKQTLRFSNYALRFQTMHSICQPATYPKPSTCPICPIPSNCPMCPIPSMFPIRRKPSICPSTPFPPSAPSALIPASHLESPFCPNSSICPICPNFQLCPIPSHITSNSTYCQ
jgi:hypothetical protein